MIHVIVDASRCPSNHYCPVINSCPTGAIIQDSDFSAPWINHSKCILCAKCMKICPAMAFILNDNA